MGQSQASVSISLITVAFSLLIVFQEGKKVELVRTSNSFLREENSFIVRISRGGILAELHDVALFLWQVHDMTGNCKKLNGFDHSMV